MTTDLTVTTVEDQLTMDQFRRVLPKGVKANITQDMLDNINGIVGDSVIRDSYRENLLSYTGVMTDGKYKMQSYIDAVRYVSHKLLGSPNIVSYAQTFPKRYQRLLNDGADEKTISSYVAAYNKTKLVNKIFEQTLVPSHILNADLYQKALNKQATLMATAASEKVQCEAANSLLIHLKMPESAKLEIDIGIKQDKSIDILRDAIVALAGEQKKSIESKTFNVKDIAHSDVVIKGDYEELPNANG